MSNEPLSFSDPNDISASNLGHLSNETWLPVSSDGSEWVETGVEYGYNYNGCIETGVCGIGGCNCDSYDYFWADNGINGFYIHYVAEWTPDGTQHTYQIINDSLVPNSPNGQSPYYWDIYIDGTYYGVSTDETNASTYGYNQTTGFEDFDGQDSTGCPQTGNEQCISSYNNEIVIDADESTGSFYNYSSLLVNDAWQYPSSYSSWEIDFGCNIYPAGYCLNGYPYSGNEWWNNKP